MPRWFTSLAILLMVCCSPVRAATLHDESIHGDLSGDRLNPTHHVLQGGTNSVVAATGPGDLEYFTLVVPSGATLDEVILSRFDGESFVSFLAVQQGETFTIAPAAAVTAAGMLGWTHLSNVGGDLLAAMSVASFGSAGFSPPLGAGSYTFWLQEIDAPVTFQLDFNVTAVPEPGVWAMLACGLGILVLRRRRNVAHVAFA